MASERGTTMEVGPSAGFVVQPCGLDTELLTVPRYNSSHQSLAAVGKTSPLAHHASCAVSQPSGTEGMRGVDARL